MERNITIIGAGLGGLTLASILYKNGVRATIYELEASPSTRHQGSVLDMHEESGQLALRKAGLFEEFQKHIIPSGDDMRILDKTGAIRWQDSGNNTRPEVNRGALRDMLLRSLPSTYIHWDSKVSAVEAMEEGGYLVTLASGETFTTSLLIGADGAWSKVRPLLSNAQPVYLGVSFVETYLLNALVQHLACARLVGHGTMAALSDEKGLMTHMDGDGHITVYIGLKTSEQWIHTSEIDFHDREKAKQQLLTYFADWDERLRALITESDTELIPRALYSLPAGHRWQHQAGVTLLGDAAHLMSPFAGEGANQAMLDGAELADALLANPNDTESALVTYEATMFPRAELATAESLENLNVSIRADAPQGMVDLMNQFAHQQ